MKIAIVTDKSRTLFSKDIEAEKEDAQKQRTVIDLKKVISNRYDCIDLTFDADIIQNLKEEKIDLVFNLCNGVIGESRLSQLPGILESMEIPYTGSKPLAHGLAYNKIYSGMVFKENNIPTPDFIYVSSMEELENIDMKFPVFVKPPDEGSSRGIYQDSIVKDKESLKKIIKASLEKYNPPIMIMEYVEGREFTVGIIENGKRMLPILEVDFTNLPDGLNHINSFEVKNEYDKHVIYHMPAKLDKELQLKIEKTAKDAFEILGLNDYSRIDIIVKDSIPYVIEANSLPGLEKGYSDLCKMAEEEFDYESLVFGIIDSAKTRYKL